MRKKILFCLEALNCGGIETSAVTFLQSLDSTLFDVTLCINRPNGDLLPQIPSWVKVQVLPYGPIEVLELTRGRKAVVKKLLLHGRIISVLRWILFGMKLRNMTEDQHVIATQRRQYRTLHPDPVDYDLAISYSELTQIQYVADFVKARRKAVWMHTELSHAWSDVRTYLSFFRKMDYIFCVSPSLAEAYRKVLPECVERIREYRHLVNPPMIRAHAEAETIEWPVGAGGLRILSVGRLARQKGFDLIPEIASRLKRKDRDFSWLIIGEGEQRAVIQSLIEQYHVADRVSLVGQKLNPFPFFKACDIYVQPSRYEGYCLTVAEARVFNKPIVATDFNGAREQLKNGASGIIVPCDVVALSEALDRLLVDEDCRKKLIANSNGEFEVDGINAFVERLLEGNACCRHFSIDSNVTNRLQY